MSSYGAGLPSVARSFLSSCRPALREQPIAASFAAFQQVRGFKQAKGKGKGKKETKSDRKGLSRDFRQKNLKDMEQFALCDAMRYVHLA